MRKKLVVLDVVLLALIAGAAWQLRERYLEDRARDARVLRKRVKAEPAPLAAPARPPQPVASGTYGEVAQKMLFAKDRNPNVIIEAAPAKPQPPLPVAHGVMDLGDGPVILLSEKPGDAHRGYMPGDKIGEFKLVAVNYEEVIFEWDGQQFKKSISDLIGKAPAQQQTPAQAQASDRLDRRTPAAASSQSAAAAQTTVVAPVNQTGPGQTIGGDFRACNPADTSPPGTVAEGYKKEVFDTAFGKACRWVVVR